MMSAKRRVLIVDDHAAVRRGLHDLIESSGRYEIVGQTWNGRSALEMAEESLPDIVTLEYSLPCLSGLEVAHRLQRSMPAVEILVYTRYERQDCLPQMLRAGARAYVAKTDPGEKILEALEALSSNQPYLSENRPEAFLSHMLPARSGRPNKRVAKPVEPHHPSILQKLKQRTTAHLMRFAARNNIVMA
jgi:DNA-binding NarL/FixJ family response regulator